MSEESGVSIGGVLGSGSVDGGESPAPAATVSATLASMIAVCSAGETAFWGILQELINSESSSRKTNIDLFFNNKITPPSRVGR